MKKVVLSVALVLSIILILCACADKNVASNPWDSATYKENTEFGSGSTTVVVKLVVQDKTVDFTINTDKTTLGDALLEHKLISGENSTYGLYVKVVNGIEADYNKTNSYWAFTKDGTSLLTGVDGEKISSGNKYEIIYTEN